MTVYYNEIDPFCAEWLRKLIKAGQIQPGDVDERDIRDVTPVELVGYDQCHYSAFAGYRKTWSDYSLVQCRTCGETWRTKAKYVEDPNSPLAPENWHNLSVAERRG